MARPATGETEGAAMIYRPTKEEAEEYLRWYDKLTARTQYDEYRKEQALDAIRTETEFNGELCRFTGPCIHTGERYSVTVPQRAVIEWVRGDRIQDVLPERVEGGFR